VIDAVVPADADAVLALLEIEARASSMFVPIPGVLAAADVILSELSSFLRRE
jgi:hypothetical protein